MSVGVAPLRLERAIPLKDVRQLIWRYLRPIERELIKCAHAPSYVTRIRLDNAWILFKDGFLDVIRWLVQHASYTGTFVHIRYALLHGHAHIFDWALQERLITPSYEHLRAFVETGHLERVEWFHTHHKHHFRTHRGSLDLMWDAARHGHLHLIIWFHTHYCAFVLARPVSNNLFYAAARGGHLSVILWLIDRGYEMPTDTVCNAAVRESNIELLDWLLFDAGVPSSAFTNLTLYSCRALKWYYERGIATDWSVFVELACQSCTQDDDMVFLSLLRWGYIRSGHGLRVDEDSYSYIIYRGYRKSLQWLYHTFNDDALRHPRRMINAARMNNLSMLEWLYQIGVRPDESALVAAYKGQRLKEGDYTEVIAWLRAHGAPQPTKKTKKKKKPE